MTKGIFVLLAADLFVCWWFVNGLLMLWLPQRFNGFVVWPRTPKIDESAGVSPLSQRRIRLLGISFMATTGIFALKVLLPATVVLVLWFFRHYLGVAAT